MLFAISSCLLWPGYTVSYTLSQIWSFAVARHFDIETECLIWSQLPVEGTTCLKLCDLAGSYLLLWVTWGHIISNLSFPSILCNARCRLVSVCKHSVAYATHADQHFTTMLCVLFMCCLSCFQAFLAALLCLHMSIDKEGVASFLGSFLLYEKKPGGGGQGWEMKLALCVAAVGV